MAKPKRNKSKKPSKAARRELVLSISAEYPEASLVLIYDMLKAAQYNREEAVQMLLIQMQVNHKEKARKEMLSRPGTDVSIKVDHLAKIAEVAKVLPQCNKKQIKQALVNFKWHVGDATSYLLLNNETEAPKPQSKSERHQTNSKPYKDFMSEIGKPQTAEDILLVAQENQIDGLMFNVKDHQKNNDAMLRKISLLNDKIATKIESASESFGSDESFATIMAKLDSLDQESIKVEQRVKEMEEKREKENKALEEYREQVLAQLNESDDGEYDMEGEHDYELSDEDLEGGSDSESEDEEYLIVDDDDFLVDSSIKTSYEYDDDHLNDDEALAKKLQQEEFRNL